MNEVIDYLYGKPLPEPLRQALLSFAETVRKVNALMDDPSPDPLSEYLYREYRAMMEDMFIDQLVATVPTQAQRDDILSEAGLDYLSAQVDIIAAELGDDN